jgi:hypothetical protein
MMHGVKQEVDDELMKGAPGLVLALAKGEQIVAQDQGDAIVLHQDADRGALENPILRQGEDVRTLPNDEDPVGFRFDARDLFRVQG